MDQWEFSCQALHFGKVEYIFGKVEYIFGKVEYIFGKVEYLVILEAKKQTNNCIADLGIYGGDEKGSQDTRIYPGYI